MPHQWSNWSGSLRFTPAWMEEPRDEESLVHLVRRAANLPVISTKPTEQERKNAMLTIGRKLWAIAEGYIPEGSHGAEPEFTSHETACILNTYNRDAKIEITIFFSDREPIGPYRVTVPARRTMHLRFNDLKDPAPIPLGTDYASVIESDVPIVVQHTRLDSRQAENALMTTVAWSE